MTYRVCIVGHSNTPKFVENIPNVILKIFRKPGAIVSDVYLEPLRNSFAFNPHLTVIYLGGNDLVSHSGREVLDSLLKLVSEFKKYGEVIVVNIEPREYSDNNRFGISNEEYKLRARYVNRYLDKLKTRRGYELINLTSRILINHRTFDGVHFTKTGSSMIAAKIRNAIVYWLLGK